MTFSDYLIDSVLVLIVLRQVRESRLDWKVTVLPFGIAGWVGLHYLHALPSGGHDLLLIAGFTAIGVTFGLISGFATRVRADGGKQALVKAGVVAAGVWVLGMGFRFGFSIWSSTSGGAHALTDFSVAHGITSAAAWTWALVLMALGEVVVRTVVLVVRGHHEVAIARRSSGVAQQLVTV